MCNCLMMMDCVVLWLYRKLKSLLILLLILILRHSNQLFLMKSIARKDSSHKFSWFRKSSSRSIVSITSASTAFLLNRNFLGSILINSTASSTIILNQKKDKTADTDNYTKVAQLKMENFVVCLKSHSVWIICSLTSMSNEFANRFQLFCCIFLVFVTKNSWYITSIAGRGNILRT